MPSKKPLPISQKIKTIRNENVIETVIKGYAALMTHKEVQNFVQEIHGELISVSELKAIYSQISGEVNHRLQTQGGSIQVINAKMRIALLEKIIDEAMSPPRGQQPNLQAAIAAIKVINEMLPNKGKALTEEQFSVVKAAYERAVQQLQTEEGMSREEAVNMLSNSYPDIAEYVM